MRVKQRPVPALFLSEEEYLDALGQGEADQGPQQQGTAPAELSAGSAGPDGAAAQHGPRGQAAAGVEGGAEEESEDAKDDAAAAGTVWEMDREFTTHWSSAAPHIVVPRRMMRACFPGVELPLAVQLRLEVDGHPWGAPFKSWINRASKICAGLTNFPELSGCRVVGLRQETCPDGPAAITALLSSLQAERHGADEWPMKLRITKKVLSEGRITVSKGMVQAWWPDAAMPLDLTASFAVNGAAAGQPLQAQLQTGGQRPRHWMTFLEPPPPLAHDSTITCVKRLSPSSIQLRATPAAAPGAGAAAGAAGALHSTSRVSAVHTGGKRRRPQREWQDSSSDEEAGSSSDEEAVSRDEEAGSSSEEGGEVEEEKNGGGSSLQPAALPQRTQPVGAQLQALALPRIALPAGSHAVAEVGCTAMLEAQRAAEALGLPPAQFAAVCRGMQRATADADGARRFLAGDYPSLRYACGAGDESVAREWMERVAARAAD